MKPRKLGSHLEWHSGSIRVVVSVPVPLQSIIGATKLKRSLLTDSPARAELLKWAVIRDLKAKIAEAARSPANDARTTEALAWRKEREEAPGPRDADDDDQYGTVSSLLNERAEEIEKEAGRSAALAFFGIARGSATPVRVPLETFLGQHQVSPSYKGDIRRSVERLAAWGSAEGVPITVEGMTRKVAGRYLNEWLAPTLTHRLTVNKDTSALRVYWGWLADRGYLADEAPNPWRGISLRGKASGEKSRAFTDAEVIALLNGPASPRNRDIMLLGALTGARIDELCRLQVRDCQGGLFFMNARRDETGEGKSDAAKREVPIHSLIAGLVADRCAGKPPEACLIDGLPAPDPKGIRKTSMPASKEFTRYRREMGVDDMIPGARRSKTVFHSWRHWFITTALRAGQELHIVSAVVAHAAGRAGVTLTVYDKAGPSDDQRRAVVESVRLPPGAPIESPPGPRMGEGGKRNRARA